MIDKDSKGVYIPLNTIYGKPNPDGTYTLTALDIKNLNDNLYALAKKIQGGLTLADMTDGVNKEFTDMSGDILTVQATAQGAAVTASSAAGAAATAQITANGASATARDAYGKAASVELTVNGLTISNPDGTTTIDGNKIKSGTIEGVTLKSINSGNDAMVNIYNGGIDLGTAPYWVNGSFYYDTYDGRVFLETVPGTVLKLVAGSNMSIDSNGTIYIGTSPANSGNVNIGQDGGTVNLNGDVKVNGVPL